MTRASWDATWLDVARVVARRSACVRAQVGAVVVDATQRVISTGYNGAPAGYRFGESCAGSCPRADGGATASYDDCVAIHAEANALMFGDRRERLAGTMYATDAPCFTCAKLVANSGVARAVFPIVPDQPHRTPEASIELLRNSGLEVVVWSP